MNRKNIVLIVASFILILLIILGVYLQNKKTQNSAFPLTDIKLGNINQQSKEVLYTNAFLKSDDF